MRLRPKKNPFHLSLGNRGEMIAGGFLLRNGYKILEKNYRCKIGEIDIIAQKNGRLIFIEVKTRLSDHLGSPEESVHKMKQKKIVKVAEWYRKEKQLEDTPLSFEVIAIRWQEGQDPQIRLILDAIVLDRLNFERDHD